MNDGIPAVKVNARSDRTRYCTLKVHAPVTGDHGVLVIQDNYSGRSESFSLTRDAWAQLARAVADDPQHENPGGITR